MATTPLTLKMYNIQTPDFSVAHGLEKPYVLKIRDLPVEDKPREKLIKYGPSILSLSELLAIVFNVGTRKEEVLTMSTRLLREYGEKAFITQKDPKRISETLDIPLTKACQLVACFEIGRRFFKTPNGKPEFLRTASQVYEYLKDMRELPKEHLRGLYLNNHYQLVHDEVISIGSLSANIVHPREVFKPAFEYYASAIIIAHNHPSGMTEPSTEDIQITKQLIEAGKILGIHVLDHIVVSKKGFASVAVDYE
jgi:DNA repair protein RadC